MEAVKELLALILRIRALAAENPGMSLALAFDRPVGGDTALKDTSIRDALHAMSEDPAHYVDAYVSTLVEFIDDVNATGGIELNSDFAIAPLGSLDWPDLAHTYMHATVALGVEPIVVDGDGDPVSYADVQKAAAERRRRVEESERCGDELNKEPAC